MKILCSCLKFCACPQCLKQIYINIFPNSKKCTMSCRSSFLIRLCIMSIYLLKRFRGTPLVRPGSLNRKDPS